jgi:hypothetical protein
MQQQRVYVYRGGFPLAGVLLLPVLVFLLSSLFAAVVAGGLIGSAVLPLVFGRRRRADAADDGRTITLDRDQYRVVEPEVLPETRQRRDA